MLLRLKLTTAILLILAVLGGYYLLYEFYALGRISVEEIPPGRAVSLAPQPEFRVAILASHYTADFLGPGSGYPAHVNYWKGLLEGLNWPYDVITDAQLEEESLPHQVLILPAVLCLTSPQKAAIRNFLREGKGVVATWATGVRSANGTWQGWQFLQELTNAAEFQFPQKEPPWYVTFHADSPLTVGAPMGSRVQITSSDWVAATALNVDAYWSNFELLPAETTLPENFQGAVLHQERGPSRVVWMGFQENAAAGGIDKSVQDAFLLNSLAWAGRRTLVGVDPWPHPHSGAVVLALDVEQDSPSNAAYSANTLLRSRAPGTFFCLADAVQHSPNLVRTLSLAGEVASHGKTHAGLEQAAAFDQLIGFLRSKWTLWQLTGLWATGFHPPNDALSPGSYRALAGARFRYYFTGPLGNSVRPAVLRVSQRFERYLRGRPLVRLVRMTHDDLRLSPLGFVGLDPDWIVERLKSDSEFVRHLAGLYILSYHTQGLSRPEYVSVFPKLIDYWRSNGVWVATADQVARWWLQRSEVEVDVTGAEGKAIRVTVTSHSSEPLKGVALTLYPGLFPSQASVRPQQPGPPAVLEEDSTQRRFRLRLPPLQPGRAYIYDLVLNEERSQEN